MKADTDVLPAYGEDLVWAQLQDTDSEIAHVETLLNQLVLKRAVLRKKLNQYSSPLLRLPPEISSDIFKACIRREEGTGGQEIENAEDNSQGAVPLPILISGVCSAWRELACSMTWMWSSIALVLDNASPIYPNLLDEYLSRSGHRALNIRLICGFLDEKNEDVVLEVMSVVARFSERWSHVTFNIPLSCYDALRSVQGRLPLLTSLSAKLSAGVMYQPLPIFSVAPQLQVARCVDFLPEFLPLPIGQLTSLSGYQSNLIDFLKILSAASYLMHGSFNIPSSLNLIPPTPDRVLAPHLQSLEFHGLNDRNFVDSLLDHVTLPDLRQLSFRFREDNYGLYGFPVASFLLFISRSTCQLQVLSIIGVIVQDRNVLHCIQAIPSLTELTLDARGITNQTIRNLNPNFFPLLPNLQALAIGSTNLVVNFTDLYNTVFARSRPVGADKIARLQSVKIRAVDADEDTCEPSLTLLRQLVAEGIEISVTSGVFEKWL
jgi:hypothetical protein